MSRLVCCSLLCVVLVDSAPRGQGRIEERVDAAIDAVLDSRADEMDRADAADELARLPPAAATRLVQRWLDDLARGEPPARLGGMPISSPVREAMTHALSSMGPGSEGAARRLLDEVQALRWKTAVPALQLLADVGPWHASLRESLRQVEAVGVDELQRAAPRGMPESGVRYLQAFHEAAWHRLRLRAAIDPSADDGALVRLLTDGNATEIEFAAQVLASRRSAARAAVPALAQTIERALLDDVPLEPKLTVGCSEWVRRAAVDALAAIAPDDPASIVAHRARLAPPYAPSVRAEAARALARFGARASSAVPELIAMRQSWDDDDLMMAAVEALAAIGPAARDAIPLLEDLRTEVFWNDELVAAAARALAAIERR